jgi:ribose 5-phosphate isomerase A
MQTTIDRAEPQRQYKKDAAVEAVSLIESGMRIGLGTGSTAIWATRRIAELLETGALRDITAIATSKATHEEAVRLGIPLLPDDLPSELDLTIDGADEVDPELNVIKGGGGALLREKLVAQVSRREIIVVDDSKPSPCLGTRYPALPVEVLPFGWSSQARFLEKLGARITMRQNADGTRYITDSGNFILDCAFGPIQDAAGLAARLGERAGIIEHGLFIGLTTDLIVAGPGGIWRVERARREAEAHGAPPAGV